MLFIALHRLYHDLRPQQNLGQGLTLVRFANASVP